jgi:hypothetical protein
MKQRSPPAFATWLLMRFASAYQRDSFIGDLNELYQQNGSRFWYWKQVAAVLIGGKVFVRTIAESVALISLAFSFYKSGCGNDESTLVATVALLGLMVSIALRASTPSDSSERRLPIKRFLTGFAAITLSVATLTWAGSTSVRSNIGADSAICARPL